MNVHFFMTVSKYVIKKTFDFFFHELSEVYKFTLDFRSKHLQGPKYREWFVPNRKFIEILELYECNGLNVFKFRSLFLKINNIMINLSSSKNAFEIMRKTWSEA